MDQHQSPCPSLNVGNGKNTCELEKLGAAKNAEIALTLEDLNRVVAEFRFRIQMCSLFQTPKMDRNSDDKHEVHTNPDKALGR